MLGDIKKIICFVLVEKQQNISVIFSIELKDNDWFVKNLSIDRYTEMNWKIRRIKKKMKIRKNKLVESISKRIWSSFSRRN